MGCASQREGNSFLLFSLGLKRAPGEEREAWGWLGSGRHARGMGFCTGVVWGSQKQQNRAGLWHPSLCCSSVGASLGGLSQLPIQVWPKHKHLGVAGQASYPSAELCSDLHTNKLSKKKEEKERG